MGRACIPEKKVESTIIQDSQGAVSLTEIDIVRDSVSESERQCRLLLAVRVDHVSVNFTDR